MHSNVEITPVNSSDVSAEVIMEIEDLKRKQSMSAKKVERFLETAPVDWNLRSTFLSAEAYIIW